MTNLVRSIVSAALVFALCACGNQTAKTADITLVQPLSQVEWTQLISAEHSAKVGNNSFMALR